MKTATVVLFFLFLAAMVYIFFRPQIRVEQGSEIVVYRDSIVRDTIRDTVFFVEKQTVVRNDTLVVNDTIYKLLPISRYEFNDSTYRFVVEGYNVKPILLETYPVTYYRFKETTKQKRVTNGWNIGVGAFYGTKGFDLGVYVGYGVLVRF